MHRSTLTTLQHAAAAAWKSCKLWMSSCLLLRFQWSGRRLPALCCRRDDKESKFDGASLSVLHGVKSLTMLRFEQNLAEDDDRPREQPAPPQELVAAVADLKQHNPVLKVPVGIRAPHICGHSEHPSHGWHVSALCIAHMQLRIAGGFLPSLQLGVTLLRP